MQAPGRPDEDVRGGFERGGWANSYSDEVMSRRMAAGMSQAELGSAGHCDGSVVSRVEAGLTEPPEGKDKPAALADIQLHRRERR